MEENTTTNTTPANTNSGNTTMFIIGAIVLAGILGYVIFSSNNETTPSTSNDEPVVVDETTPESTDESSIDNNSMNQDSAVQEMPEMTTMDLKLNANGTPGTELDTTATNMNVKIFKVEAGFPYYKPNLITVKKGDTVRIEMTSVDMMHDFVIDEFGAKLPITKAGETNTVEFVADKAGSFEYYCSVGQHRQNGQFGTLVVQE